MNKRLDDIAIRAKTMVEEGSNRQISFNHDLKAFAEKFAELIVKDCVAVAELQRNPSTLNYKPCERFADELRHHFGVK